MKSDIYSYIVASDSGFAPNPFHGFCTLACCKPRIRTLNGAQIGDYVVGLSPKHSCNRLVYAMRVTEKMTFDEYWNDPRFNAKRPNMAGGPIEKVGDNIYHWDHERREYRQEWSRHSNPDGTEHQENKHHDTKGNDYWVLISDNFIYWGAESIELPREFEGFILEGSNHRCPSNAHLVPAFEEWFIARKQVEDGQVGIPFDRKQDSADTPLCAPQRRSRKKC